jgi:hypothetical protein
MPCRDLCNRFQRKLQAMPLLQPAVLLERDGGNAPQGASYAG